MTDADRAKLGREMRRMTVEDALVFSSASEAGPMIVNAIRKAFPGETANGILQLIGEEAK